MSANITNTPADEAPDVTATPGPERLAQALRAQHRARIAHDAPLVLGAHLFLIGVVLTLVWNHGHVTAWEWWCLAIAVTTAARAAWQRQARLASVRDEDVLIGTRTLVLLQGLAWGIGAAFLVAELPVEHAAIVLVGMAGLMACAANTLVADPASFYLLIGSVYAPVLVSLVLTASDRDDMITAVMTAAYVYVLHTLHRRAYRALRRQIETNAAVEEKAALLESQVRASADGLLIVDGRGHKLLQNQRFLDIWDIPPEIGADLSDTRTLETALSRLRDPKAFAERVAHLYAHPDEVSHDEIELINGRVYDRFSAPVIGARGMYYGRIWSFHDVTELKQVATAMREAKELAEQAARTRSMFLANMSHEIRTPMNAVLGLAEILLDDELPAEQRHSVELIRSSGESLLSIINDVLDFSKLEAGHLDVESIPFDLAHLVYTTASVLAVRAAEKGVELIPDLDGTPTWVQGDPGRLRQVLTNLIGNAVKFTERGEVVVRVAPTSLADGRPAVRFAVQDTGIGIAADQLTKIFQEFTQVDGSSSRRYGGTGLGLTIAQRLVGLMGGHIDVTSQLGKGSEFTFTIPLAAVAPPATAKPVVHIPLVGRRVMVVDDNSTNRRIFREMLAADGARVDEASSASSALATLRSAVRTGDPVGLVIIDARMPDHDGFELAAQVRQDSALKTLPLLMLTSAGQRGDAARCRALGVAGYLTKPISRTDFFQAVAAALGKERSETVEELVTRHTLSEARRNLRILLAEDNVVNQEVAATMLRRRGHQVDVVGDGTEAVAAVEKSAYDVVLMDVQMPEMDGFEATAAIRKLPQGAGLPIIALTAHALAGERERCLEHGLNGYLAKPVKAQELFAAVESWGGGRKAA